MAAVRSKRDLPPEEPIPRPAPRQWWEGEEPVELRLTANAGVLLTFRGEKLLVDGLHNSRAHDFSPVAPEMLAALAAGAPPWDGIRWLFYTHLHIDHFSGRETIRFLEGNRVEKLFLPAGNGG
ncbi:MAG: MBL fold metallo-hydrolase, partial [Clostridiales bacterium]|nr:MBL fold metallo-hydrolase [Clostridiales bacterium]